MSEWIKVSKEEMLAYVKAYPRHLVLNVNQICIPDLISWHDFELTGGPGQNQVARYYSDFASVPEGGYEVRKPVPVLPDTAAG